MNAPAAIARPPRAVRAALGFRAAGGQTFLARQRMPHPFHITVPFHEPTDPQGMTTLYLQSSAGGYYGDDDLSLDVGLGPGAALHLTSQASTIVHHARGGSGTRAAVSLRAAPGSLLEYCPDPTILLAGSALRSRLLLELEGDACAILCDAQLPHDPSGAGLPFAHLSNKITLTRDGAPILIDRLDIAGADWPARTGGMRAAGTMIIAGAPQDAPAALRAALADLRGTYLGVSDLADRGLTLIRLLAEDGAALSRALSATWIAARTSLTGAAPRRRRK